MGKAEASDIRYFRDPKDWPKWIRRQVKEIRMTVEPLKRAEAASDRDDLICEAMTTLRDAYLAACKAKDEKFTQAIDLAMQAITRPLADHGEFYGADWDGTCWCAECRNY